MRKKLNRLGVIVKFERFPSASRLKVKINRKGNATQKLIVIFKHLKILIVKLVDCDWHIFNCFSNFHKTLVTAITLLALSFSNLLLPLLNVPRYAFLIDFEK